MFRRKEEFDFGEESSNENNNSKNDVIVKNSASNNAPASTSPAGFRKTAHNNNSSNNAAPVIKAPARPAYGAANSVTHKPAVPVSAQEKTAKKVGRVLTVGHEIFLKGEIATCDRLVIEGSVDATLKDVHTVEIAETGSFKGCAEIENIEISGLFEGDLVVRGVIKISSTGRVFGKITYGEIEIERGGKLIGEISLKSDSSTKKKVA